MRLTRNIAASSPAYSTRQPRSALRLVSPCCCRSRRALAWTRWRATTSDSSAPARSRWQVPSPASLYPRDLGKGTGCPGLPTRLALNRIGVRWCETLELSRGIPPTPQILITCSTTGVEATQAPADEGSDHHQHATATERGCPGR